MFDDKMDPQPTERFVCVSRYKNKLPHLNISIMYNLKLKLNYIYKVPIQVKIYQY